MAQIIEQPESFLGAVGRGLGQGFQNLASQAPKEFERARLAEGLKRFSEQSGNLTPLQGIAQVASIPGLPPQLLQALPELYRQQGLRQSYQNLGNQQQQQPEGQIGRQGALPQVLSQATPQTTANVAPEARGQPQIVENNPLRPEAQPAKTWTPQRKEQDISNEIDKFPNSTIQEAVSRSADNERRYMEQPEAERRIDDYQREQQEKLDTDIDKKLQLKLEKTGEGIFKDITGENLNNLRRSAYQDLSTNPNATIEDVSNYWTNKALDLAKSKTNLKKLSQKDFLHKISHGNETLDKLKTYQKSFAETGNQEEFYNFLQEKFNISPQVSAYIAYPRSKPVSNYIEKAKPIQQTQIYQAPAMSRKYAVDMENLINRDDSLLAIAKEFRQKDPLFDQNSFFKQLRKDQDNLGLTPRQKRELQESESETFPNWGDILYLPIIRG